MESQLIQKSSVTYQQLETQFERLKTEHTCLLSWQLKLDKARRRAGACHPAKKLITLSEHHLKLNDKATVLDTLLHEVAHAIVWERHRDTGHGARWKRMVSELGGTARATGQFHVPAAQWILVYCDKEKQHLKKLAERHRRNKHISSYMLRGQPETRGYLYYMSREDYNKWQNNPDYFESIEFYQ